MTDNSSRYTVSGDNAEMQYVDEAQTVLVNKLGITDLGELQEKEEELLIKAYELLFAEIRSDTPGTCELLKHIHRQIFGELYEWAGNWRTVNISKPGVNWPPPNHLESAMQEFEQSVLSKYSASAINNDNDFCKAVGQTQGEFLAIHPFREGNARAIKLYTDILAAQTERPILYYDNTDQGKQNYIEAAKSAILKDYDPITSLIEEALIASMKES